MSWPVFLALVLPGLLVGYALFLRPVLHAMPTFSRFYAEADGFWQKVWALCGKSVTLAFAYVIQGISWALQWIDPIANFLGDPDFRQQLTETLQANPKILGWVLMGISAVTIAARMRSLMPKDDD
ncbi:hypothetical protein ASC80_01795 [Afipia sp. Root123D2]|uniref:hypothetical protein n=1 Tax=Afipia sp. Root123D2 TaxID=1736436 RepID=UPI0006F33916|nr:hypothetical protein [Afipia sp. Root123D2]KQW22156.1 hypothetical protein ASC80_01795 [Afipia sp. Root123D2]